MLCFLRPPCVIWILSSSLHLGHSSHDMKTHTQLVRHEGGGDWQMRLMPVAVCFMVFGVRMTNLVNLHYQSEYSRAR